MIFLIYIHNLTTIGPAVSEVTCLIKMDTDTRQTNRQTNGNGKLLFSYSWFQNSHKSLLGITIFLEQNLSVQHSDFIQKRTEDVLVRSSSTKVIVQEDYFWMIFNRIFHLLFQSIAMEVPTGTNRLCLLDQAILENLWSYLMF